MADSPTYELLQKGRAALVCPPAVLDFLEAKLHGPGDWRPALEELQGRGILTPFQADRLRAGDIDGLVAPPYRLLDQIRRDERGDLYRAEHALLGLPVLLRRQAALHQPSLHDLQCRLAPFARVNSAPRRSFVPPCDVGLSGSNPNRVHFATPYLDGEDLDRRVTRLGPPEIDEVLAWLFQAARALEEAHRVGLPHGAVSPEVFLRLSDGRVLLVDFSCDLSENPPPLPALFHPAESLPIALVRRDLQGLGRTAFFCLTGRLGSDTEAGAVPTGGGVPAALWEVVRRLLAPPPGGFASAAEVARVLQGVGGARLLSEEMNQEQPPEGSPTLVLPAIPGRAPPIFQPTGPAEENQEETAPRILLVDDEDGIRNYCRLSLQKVGLDCREAPNGVQALAVCAERTFDLVILDVDMPQLDGLETCRRLRRQPERPYLKILLMSGRCDPDRMAAMLLAGADDYLTKPFTPIQFLARVQAALKLKSTQERSDRLRRDLLLFNDQLEKHLRDRDSDLVEARNAIVLALAKLAEYRDTDTGAHLQRLQVFSRRLAEQARDHPVLGPQVEGPFVDLLACCAPLHDIGKVGLPDHILLKPTGLDPEERLLMQTHTIIGAETLQQVAKQHRFALPFLTMAMEIARHHHERFDGTGYPDRLIGSAIPLAARFVTVCDVYDALRSRRVYKPALPHTEVVDLMQREAGKLFDPVLLECFSACSDDFASIFQELQD